MPFLRTPYNYDRDKSSNDNGLKCEDPSLAQQQFKDDTDLNKLFQKYLETGEMPQVQNGLTYGNFEGIFDFQTAMNAVRTAQGLFNELPARIKNRFDNDPQKMLEFLHDPENREEAEFLGLVNKPTTDSPGAPAGQAQQPGQPLPPLKTPPSAGNTGGTGGAAPDDATQQK